MTLIAMIVSIILCISAMGQENTSKYWTDRANASLQEGSFKDALAYATNATNVDSMGKTAWNLKGKLLWIEGIEMNDTAYFNESIKAYDKVLEIDPSDSSAWSGKGVAFLFMGAITNLNRDVKDLTFINESLKACDRAIALNPQDADSWNGKGGSFALIGSATNNISYFIQSIDCYNKSIELNSSNNEAWSNKGESYDALGRYDDAVISYNRALDIDPNHADTWNRLGNSLKALGRTDEANEAFANANRLDEVD